MFEIKNIFFKKDKKVIIDDLSIKFEPKTISIIVGANGAGKSTLARLMMGLTGYRRYRGDMKFKGKSIKRLSVYQRAKLGITLAWQEPVRFEGITVRQYLDLAGNNDIKKQNQALLRLGLDPKLYLERMVDNGLSGGERKRIELASILMMDPQVVILDEPDSGIDIDSLKYIDGVIKYFKKQGAIVILITHNLETMEKADKAYLLCKGRLIKVTSPSKIRKYFCDYCRDCKWQNKFDLDLKQ